MRKEGRQWEGMEGERKGGSGREEKEKGREAVGGKRKEGRQWEGSEGRGVRGEGKVRRKERRREYL